MDEAGPKPLDFDAWAALSARLLKRSPEERAALLADHRVESGAFDAADARHRQTLDRDLADGRTARAERYATLCAAEAHARRSAAARAALERRGPPPASVAPAVEGVAKVAVPSFLREDSQRAAMAMRLPSEATPPPGPGREDRLDRIGVAHHAALAAELELYPAHAATVLLRHGLMPGDREALATRWRLQLEGDEGVLRAWAEAFSARCREVLAKQ